MRGFEVKVNRKARRAAIEERPLGARPGRQPRRSSTARPSTRPRPRAPSSCSSSWGQEPPLAGRRDRGRGGAGQVVPQPRPGARDGARPSSRSPTVVWARSLLVTRGGAAADRGARRAQGGRRMSLHPNEVLLAPVVSEKSYSLINDRKYTFKVHRDAHKTQVRQAVEQLFDVNVENVERSSRCRRSRSGAASPRARGPAGRRRSCRCARARPSRSSRGRRSSGDPQVQADEPRPALHVGLDLRGGHEVDAGEVADRDRSRRRAAATTTAASRRATRAAATSAATA